MTKKLKINKISAAAEKMPFLLILKCVWQPVPEGAHSFVE